MLPYSFDPSKSTNFRQSWTHDSVRLWESHNASLWKSQTHSVNVFLEIPMGNCIVHSNDSVLLAKTVKILHFKKDTYLIIEERMDLNVSSETCFKILHSSLARILNATQQWWFSNGEASLYRTASSVCAFICKHNINKYINAYIRCKFHRWSAYP